MYPLYVVIRSIDQWFMCSKLCSEYVVGIGMISGDGGDGGDSDDGGDLDAVQFYAVVPCADELKNLYSRSDIVDQDLVSDGNPPSLPWWHDSWGRPISIPISMISIPMVFGLPVTKDFELGPFV